MDHEVIIGHDNSINELLDDVRTEKQERKRTSFDIGERVFGSKKQLRAMSKSKLIDQVNYIESLDLTGELADEIVNKKLYPFSLDDEKKNGVEYRAALGKMYYLYKIPFKVPINYSKVRQFYLELLIDINTEFSKITTWEQFLDWVKQDDRLNKDFIELNLFDLLNQIIEDEQASLEFAKATKRDEVDEITMKSLKYLSYGKSLIEYYRLNLSDRVNFFKILVERFDNEWPAEEKKQRKSRLVKPHRHEGVERGLERVLPHDFIKQNKHNAVFVDPRDFAAFFGFRSIEFGHYISDSEARHALFAFTESFCDIAEYFEIPYNAIGLSGTLALAFGSRGHGRALAFYQPNTKMIHFNKKNGFGSVFHEWTHALDYHLVAKLGYSYKHCMSDVFHSCLKDQVGYDPKFNTVGNLFEFFTSMFVQKQCENKLTDNKILSGKAHWTKLFLSSVEMDKQCKKKELYFSTPREMLARCFEACINLEMSSINSRNDYLVTGVDNALIYPAEAELEELLGLFRKFKKDVPKLLGVAHTSKSDLLSQLEERMMSNPRNTVRSVATSELISSDELKKDDFLDNFKEAEQISIFDIF